MASAGLKGRIDTTIGPSNGPAGVQAMSVRYIGTVVPRSMWRMASPSSMRASSKECEQPRTKATRSPRHHLMMSLRLIDQRAVFPDAVAGCRCGCRDRPRAREAGDHRPPRRRSMGRAWGCVGRNAGNRRRDRPAGWRDCPARSPERGRTSARRGHRSGLPTAPRPGSSDHVHRPMEHVAALARPMSKRPPASRPPPFWQKHGSDRFRRKARSCFHLRPGDLLSSRVGWEELLRRSLPDRRPARTDEKRSVLFRLRCESRGSAVGDPRRLRFACTLKNRKGSTRRLRHG